MSTGIEARTRAELVAYAQGLAAALRIATTEYVAGKDVAGVIISIGRAEMQAEEEVTRHKDDPTP